MDGNPEREPEVQLELVPAVQPELNEEEEDDSVLSADNSAPVKRTRVPSLIEFPYIDLEQSIAVPEIIHQQLGTKGLAEQLSGALNVRGGAFFRKVGGGRIFGLVERDGDYWKITDLGRRAINPEQAAAAKVEAFLNVPLYKRIYADFKGNYLPGDSGLENHMKELGVPAKQLEMVRQVFRRSARQAGFFQFGEDRLILPTLKEGPPAPPVSPDKDNDASPLGGSRNEAGTGNGAGSDEVEQLRRTVEELKRQLESKIAPAVATPALPPAVAGVLTTLPLDPDDKWTDADLSEWITMFRGVLRRSFKERIAPPEVRPHG